MKKHGFADFEFIILEDLPNSTVEERASREIYWISQQDQSKLYNISPGGIIPAILGPEAREKSIMNNPNRVAVVVLDNLVVHSNSYRSISAAAIAMSVGRKSIERYSLSGKLLLGRYLITRVEKK